MFLGQDIEARAYPSLLPIVLTLTGRLNLSLFGQQPRAPTI